MKREEQILKRLTEQEGGLFYDTALRAMREEENYEYKWTSDFKVVEQLNGKKI